MEKRLDDMMKELLVAGLNNYEWDSLSMPQLLMLARIIGSMESANEGTNMNASHFWPLNATNHSEVS